MTETQYYTAPNSNTTPDNFTPPGQPSPHGELSDVARRLLRSWWIIAICGIIAVGSSVGITNRTATTYQGTAYLLLNDTGFQQAVTGSAPQVNTATAEATAVDMLTPQRQAQAAAAASVRATDTYSVNITATSNSNVFVSMGRLGTLRQRRH